MKNIFAIFLILSFNLIPQTNTVQQKNKDDLINELKSEIPANVELWKTVSSTKYQDEIIFSHSSDDSYLDLQWGLREIGYDLWTEPSQMRSIIYIIDTGAPCDTNGNITHPDLQGSRFKVGSNFSQVLSVTENGDTIMIPRLNRNWDEAGHGTHVAGIASANSHNREGIAGVNNISNVVFTKILRDNMGWGYMSWLMYALAQADSVSQKDQIDIVCNLSLGTPRPFRPLEELIRKLDENRKLNGHGVILVCSAGNVQSEALDYPANYSHTGFISKDGYDNVISVGALSTKGIAEYSNFGDYVDIFAPGGEKPVWNYNESPARLIWTDGIYSTYPDSTVNDRVFYPNRDFGADNYPFYYGFNAGTSMAAPFVTAAVASYINQYGSLDSKSIKNKLRENGIPFTYNGYTEDEFGNRIPDGKEYTGYKLYLPEIFTKSTDVKDIGAGKFYVTNYPNPFNSSTTIEYYLEEQSDVVIKIFSLLGEEVRSIYQLYQPEGIHKIIFDAAGLTSGIYYCMVSAANQEHLVRKIQLLK